MYFLIAAFALVAASNGQTSRCGWELGTWVCRTDPAPTTVDPMASFRRGVDLVDRAAAQANARQNAQEARPRIDWDTRREIVRRLDSGDCRGAMGAAIAAEDAEMVSAVNFTCQSNEGPPSEESGPR